MFQIAHLFKKSYHRFLHANHCRNCLAGIKHASPSDSYNKVDTFAVKFARCLINIFRRRFMPDSHNMKGNFSLFKFPDKSAALSRSREGTSACHQGNISAI